MRPRRAAARRGPVPSLPRSHACQRWARDQVYLHIGEPDSVRIVGAGCCGVVVVVVSGNCDYGGD